MFQVSSLRVLGFGVWGLGVRVEELGFRVLGFRGFRFRPQASGLCCASLIWLSRGTQLGTGRGH